jgi:hypothetical protein
MAMRSIRGRRQLWAAAVLALAGGCYDPQLVDPGLFLCPDQRCPEGFACNAQQRCVRVAADGGADQRTGRRADGGGDSGTGRAALSCSAEDPLQVTQANESAIGMIGLVADESGALAVSYPAAIFEGNSEDLRQVVLARRAAVPTDGAPTTAVWTRQSLQELNPAAQSAVLYFTAIDTRAGQLAVAFNQRRAASDSPPLSLWVGPAGGESSGTSTKLTDLTAIWTGGPIFTGLAPAVALVQSSNSVLYALVAGQARPEATSLALSSTLAVVEAASGTRRALLQLPPPSLTASEHQVSPGGLAHRLLVNTATTPRQLLVAQLGEIVPRVMPLPGSTTLPPTLLFVSQVELDKALLGQTGISPAVAWSTETKLSVRAFGTLPLTLVPSGAALVFPQRGAAAGLFGQSIPPQATLQAIRPGDAAAATAIRPAAASREGFTGVAYLAYEGDLSRADEAAATSMFGQVCFTAATKQQEGQWTKALCLPGTAGNTGAYQVEVVASQVTAQRAVFDLVYLQRPTIAGVARLRISHSRVVCKPQL